VVKLPRGNGKFISAIALGNMKMLLRQPGRKNTPARGFDHEADRGKAARKPLRFCPAICVLCCLAASLFDPAAVSARDIVRKGDVVVIEMHGQVSSSLFMFIRRAEKLAETSGASAVIFDINTYGGRLDSAEQITTVLNRATLPTYSFINTNAGSAGALIALSTQHIYMAPVSAIGAAAPVLATGEDLPVTMKEKTISYWSALVRGSAAKNAHNPDIGQAFMDKDKEVKIGDRIVHKSGTLLTLNAQEAAEKINGKPVLADGIADSIADLTHKAGIRGNLVELRPTGFERLAFWITALAPLLLLGGIIGAYLEFKIPGATLPAAMAVICFTLFFLGHYLAGLAGWEVVAVFLLGLFLVLIEILFFAHSTIVFGVVGIFLMLGAIVWAMVDRYPGDTFLPSGKVLALPLLNLSIAIIAAVFIISLLARYLPRTSFYGRFALTTSNPLGPSFGNAQREFSSPAGIAAGMRGTALSVLRPSGKARFADHIVDVITQGEFIAPETPVTVVQIDGMRVVVRATAS
jgi:membrane-bound serine protease (ClpP class)